MTDEKKQIEITYNPYTVKTEIKIKGNLIKDGDLVKLTKNKRLQTWIDKIFEPTMKAARTRNIEFVFKGTEQDCEDFESAFHDFIAENDKLENILLKLFPVKSKPDLKVDKLKKIYKKAKQGPFNKFREEKMDSRFYKSLSPEFEVNVLATMSSGKSTVINALIGKDLLPSENMACTATIAKIIDNDDMNSFRVRVVNEKGKEIKPWNECNNELLKKWNKDIKNGIIEIEGNIKGVSVRESAKLVLTDTPGPNNSEDEEHFKVTDRAVNDNQLSMVLYILNATQLNIKDDKIFVEMIKKAMEKGGREAHDRFIFILNKADEFDPEKGELITKVIKKVKEYLKKNGIENPTIIPVSALLTKLIRMKWEGQILTRSDRNNLNSFIDLFVEEDEMNLLECSREFISKRIYDKLNNELQKHKDAGDDEKAAEILSGIPVVEALLDEFIEKHAVPAKIKDATDSFVTVLNLKSELESLENVLQQDDDELKKLAESIKKYENNKETVKEKADKFRAKVNSLKPSEDAYNIFIEEDKEITSIMDRMDDKFKNNYSPHEAERIIKENLDKINLQFNSMKYNLQENIKTELGKGIQALKEEYTKYVKDLLNENAFKSDNFRFVSLQENILKMPDTNILVKDANYEESYEVCVGEERHWYTLWLFPEKVYETRHETKTNMSEVWNKIRANVNEGQRRYKDQYYKNLEETINNVKNTILCKMKEIDEKMNNIMQQIKNASENRSKKEELLSENKNKKEWLKKFQAELDEILAL